MVVNLSKNRALHPSEETDDTPQMGDATCVQGHATTDSFL